jgi:hypothetical protein
VTYLTLTCVAGARSSNRWLASWRCMHNMCRTASGASSRLFSCSTTYAHGHEAQVMPSHVQPSASSGHRHQHHTKHLMPAAPPSTLPSTGCGKSTLMMTLFRIVEPAGGSLCIDGINITLLGLHQLRSRLSLVPQDPVVFSGSIRSNLDPFGQAGGDAELWAALRRAGVDGAVRAMGVSVLGCLLLTAVQLSAACHMVCMPYLHVLMYKPNQGADLHTFCALCPAGRP